MRVDACSGCGRLEATNHFGLCHDCALSWNERPRKEAAWSNTPKPRRFLIRSLQTVAVIAAIAATECAYWFLEPAFYRMNRHPYITCAFIAVIVLAVFAWFKAHTMKREILDRATSTESLDDDR
jgi:hypothetical protein